MNDKIRQKLKQLPDLPGCYLMKDSSGKIIYVGKAVNLKNRVRMTPKQRGWWKKLPILKR